MRALHINRPGISEQSPPQSSLSHSLHSLIWLEDRASVLVSHGPLPFLPGLYGNLIPMYSSPRFLSRLEKFHKTLSESDSRFMQQRGCFLVPRDQMKCSEIQDIMLEQKHFTWNVSAAVFHEWANCCRKGDNVEGSHGIVTILFASLY